MPSKTNVDPIPVRTGLRHKRKSSKYERAMNRLWCSIVAAGLVPRRWPGKPILGSTTIEVRGRKSGVMRRVPATWVEVDGERYFVAMMGEESDWVHNARAAAGHVTLKRGRRRPADLTELPIQDRAPIIQAWYKRTGSSTPHRYLGLDANAPIEEFEQIAPRWPVFRITTPVALS